AREPVPYARGFGLGGSSSVNGQIALRPHLNDFDDWVAHGAGGWTPEVALAAFVRLEDDLNFGERSDHGSGGPIAVTRIPPEEWEPRERALRDAALDLGYPWCEDVNAPTAEGVCSVPTNRRDGSRVTTNDAYLEPARG